MIYKLDLDEYKIFQLYESGHTISQIAKKFNVSPPTIRDRLGSLYNPLRDIDLNQFQRRKDITCELVVSMDRQGYSIKEMANELNCSKATISSRKREYINKYGSLNKKL